MRTFSFLLLTAVLIAGTAHAGPTPPMTPGPVIPSYGGVASVPDAAPLPEGTRFKVAFDVAKAAEDGQRNRHLESAARFLNMHARAGISPENISIVMVVHGPASKNLLDREGNSANAGLIAALVKAGVKIELCGQTAAYRGITKADLLPGVEMSLSAMTSHALLQQQGYTLNPF